MPYTIRYAPKTGIVRVDIDSAVNSTVAMDMTVEAVKLARVYDTKSMLFVFSDTAISEDTMGIYEFAKSLPDLGIDPSIRMAGVVPHEDPDHRFFETVAKNLGYDIQYFTSVDEAERWLTRGNSSSGERRRKPERMAR
jgi:hypothetical protein